jgi:signal peptidase I
MKIIKRKKIRHKDGEKRPLREVGLFLLDILYNAVIIIILVVLIRSFLISPFRVIGSSMADTLQNSEFILIDKLSYHLGGPKRGDPIVFLPPVNEKNSYKFQESVITDNNGIGLLDISDMRTEKQIFYCQNKWIQKIWLCKDKVNKADLVYYRPLRGGDDGNGAIDLSWESSYKKLVTGKEVKDKILTIEGKPDQTYILRIFNSTGPEYFVKRIIGIPGDTIRIDNGRVYLQIKGTDEYIELDEVYLNETNKSNTHLKGMLSGEFEVPEGHYFVLGDNRSHSNDSRHWDSPIDYQHTPFVSENNISGRVLVVLWPPDDMRLIPAGVLEEVK